jgi:hypothetical protein
MRAAAKSVSARRLREGGVVISIAVVMRALAFAVGMGSRAFAPCGCSCAGAGRSVQRGNMGAFGARETHDCTSGDRHAEGGALPEANLVDFRFGYAVGGSLFGALPDGSFGGS